MSAQESTVYDRLCATVARALDLDPASVGPDTGYEHPEVWDSMGHITLLMEIEREFAVRLPAAKMSQATNVARLTEILEGLQGKPPCR